MTPSDLPQIFLARASILGPHSHRGSVPAGTGLLACGGLESPDVATLCTVNSNTAIGTTVFGGDAIIAANFCTSSSNPCVYHGTVHVTFGSGGGTFQLVLKVTGAATGNIVSGSLMTVLRAG